MANDGTPVPNRIEQHRPRAAILCSLRPEPFTFWVCRETRWQEVDRVLVRRSGLGIGPLDQLIDQDDTLFYSTWDYHFIAMFITITRTVNVSDAVVPPHGGRRRGFSSRTVSIFYRTTTVGVFPAECTGRRQYGRTGGQTSRGVHVRPYRRCTPLFPLLPWPASSLLPASSKIWSRFF
jgi:hypothetical protein